MKRNIFFLQIYLWLWGAVSGLAQTTKVLPWRPDTGIDGEGVYHPEPILFVHGLNDNDGGWSTAAIPTLKPEFSKYSLSQTASDLIEADQKSGRYNAQQAAYLHTFNYGNYVKTNLPDNAQSFDHIEWNASVQQG